MYLSFYSSFFNLSIIVVRLAGGNAANGLARPGLSYSFNIFSTDTTNSTSDYTYSSSQALINRSVLTPSGFMIEENISAYDFYCIEIL